MTVPTHDEILRAMETPRKGLFFGNVDEWSLLSKLDRTVDHATKSEVKQSNIDQSLYAEQGQEWRSSVHHTSDE